MLKTDVHASKETPQKMGRRVFLRASGVTAAAVAALAGNGVVHANGPGRRWNSCRRLFSNAIAGANLDADCRLGQAGVQSDDGVVYERFSTGMMTGSREKFPLVATEKKVTRENEASSVDHLRWAQQHEHDILYPSCEVNRGDGSVYVLPYSETDPDQIRRLQVTVEGGKKMSVANWLRGTNTDEIIAIRDGSIVFHMCFGEMTPSTPHSTHSTTKAFAAFVAERVIADEHLDVNAPAASFVPELANTAYNDATLRQMMDMQALVRYRYSSDSTPVPPEWEFGTPEFRRATHERARHLRACGTLRKLPEEPEGFGEYDFLLTLKEKTGPHGSVLSYACPTISALTLVLERVTGQPFRKLLSDLFWQKLGAEHNAHLIHDGHGTSLNWGGLCVTGRDLGRFVMMLGNHGRVGEHQLLPPEVINRMKRFPNADKYNQKSNIWGVLPEGCGYSNCAPILHTPNGPMLVIGGAHSQWGVVDFAHGISIVKFSSDLNRSPARDLAALPSFSKALADVL